MTTTTSATRHVLRVADLSSGELSLVLVLAQRMADEPAGWTDALPGQALVTLFDKPSTRTRVSLAVAAHRLGMLALNLRPDELQLGRGETVPDTARVLSGYAGAVAIRTFAQSSVEELAAASSIPVINALTDEHHPCQALADLLTLRQHFGELEGLKLAYIGDGNNVAHSLLEAGALTGVSVSVACPPGYEPSDEVLDRAHRLQDGHAGFLEVTHDPERAVAGADAVYTDVWVSMGEEEERAARLRALEAYRVTERLMALARPTAVFLHCLPAHRGEEVEAAVIDGPASAVWQQAANRLPTEQALIYALITGDWGGRS